MGAYLPKPVKEKTSESGGNANLRYGACAMQGWRTHQEDAHNCITNFDEDKTAFFAVYDGHGGHEVAEYAARKFPEMLKSMEMWSKGRLGQALEDAFMKFDESLVDPQIVEDLKAIVGASTDKDGEENDDDEEDKLRLIEEANLPLEDVLSRYGVQFRVVSGGDEADGDQKTFRFKRTTKKQISIKKIGVKKRKEQACVDENGINNEQDDKNADATGRKPENNDAKVPVPELKEEKMNGNLNHDVNNKNKSSPFVNGDIDHEKHVEKSNVIEVAIEPPCKKQKIVENGEIVTAKLEDNVEKCIELTETVVEKDVNVQEIFKSVESIVSTKITSEQKEDDENDLESAVDAESEEDDEEYEDESEAKDEESSDIEDEESEGEEDADEVEEDVLEEETTEVDDFPVPTEDKPGVSSGTTACVVVLRGRTVYVANAGDSRCVMCRGGRAFDLSEDHKPEDDIERRRILAAGGKITEEGRVNGGLNLSRAFGDHFYKTNTNLPLRDQMISCLPDIKVEILLPEDKFLVVACDGIWNSMSSQAVVDFVSSRLEKGLEPTQICEEICDSCLADDTLGDGTGCDNMTVIIVDLHHLAASKNEPPKNNCDAKAVDGCDASATV